MFNCYLFDEKQTFTSIPILGFLNLLLYVRINENTILVLPPACLLCWTVTNWSIKMVNFTFTIIIFIWSSKLNTGGVFWTFSGYVIMSQSLLQCILISGFQKKIICTLCILHRLWNIHGWRAEPSFNLCGCNAKAWLVGFIWIFKVTVTLFTFWCKNKQKYTQAFLYTYTSSV